MYVNDIKTDRIDKEYDACCSISGREESEQCSRLVKNMHFVNFRNTAGLNVPVNFLLSFLITLSVISY